MKLCVTTVIARDWDVPTTVTKLAEMGYDGVEWRVSPGCSLTNETIEAEAGHVRDLCAKHNLAIPALAANVDAGNEALLRQMFAVAKAMGARTSRIQSVRYDGSVNYHELVADLRRWLRTAVQVAAETGVKALLELHGGTIIPSAAACRRVVEGFDPEHLGVIFDPGNQVREGMEHWKLGLECLGEYLDLVHVKNCAWFLVEQDGQRQWQVQSLPLDQGIADWQEIIGFLKQLGYTGYLSLEDFTARPTEERCRAAVDFLRPLIAD